MYFHAVVKHLFNSTYTILMLLVSDRLIEDDASSVLGSLFIEFVALLVS